MVDPEWMCRKHLLGEHVEIHMFVGAINKGKSMTGYINNDLLEPMSLQPRHECIVKEMLHRGYRHNSPFPLPFLYVGMFTNEQLTHKIDAEKSKQDLLGRCPECTERWESINVVRR